MQWVRVRHGSILPRPSAIEPRYVPPVRRLGVVFFAAGLLAFLPACTGGDDEPSGGGTSAPSTSSTTVPLPPAYVDYRSEIYSDPAHWLCRGDRDDDVCDLDMDATVVAADGSAEIEEFEPAADAPVDCFYVYPTISTDPAANSDLVPAENQELHVVRQQAARLGSVCRLFAPVYRQATLTALTARLSGATPPAAESPVNAFDDVVDAWKHYMANDNGGRGVVLIGHSQGSGHLTRLIAQEIDPDPNLRARLVSAYLLGSSVRVPPDADVGGVFANVPVCRAEEETGCIVSYASFRSTSPPPAGSFFGRANGGEAACANPAALGGGSAPLNAYFSAAGASLLGGEGGTPSVPWADGLAVETPFVALPALVTAQCVERDGFSYLELTVHGDPNDPRVDDIGGDLTPEWGMHLIDANVAMGDIVDLVSAQIAAYTGE
jgi:Protein of unknown function (DUF3089)